MYGGAPPSPAAEYDETDAATTLASLAEGPVFAVCADVTLTKSCNGGAYHNFAEAGALKD